MSRRHRPRNQGVCAICPNPTTGYLCKACITAYGDHVSSVADLDEQLTTQVTRQARGPVDPNAPRAPRHTAVWPLPYDDDASRVQHRFRDTMIGLGFGYEVPLTATDVDELKRTLARSPDAGRAHKNLTNAIGDATDVIDRPTPLMYSGRCPACKVNMYGPEGDEEVTCWKCLEKYNVRNRRAEMLHDARSNLGTAADLERLLPWFLNQPIKATTIRKWNERGRLMSRGVINGDDKLYSLGDVVDLHEDSITKRKRKA